MSEAAIAEFRAAPWRLPAELHGFIARVVAGPAELLQMLELVVRPPESNKEQAAMRHAAFVALLQRSPSESLVRPLLRALRVASADVQPTIIDALVRLPGAGDAPELVDMLRDPQVELRAVGIRCAIALNSATAANALLRTWQVLPEQIPASLREHLEVMVRVLGGGALPLLERLLMRADQGERLLAIRWLGEPAVLGAGGMRLLLPLLKQADSTAIAAAIAIGQGASEADVHTHLLPLVEGKNLVLAGTIIEGLKRFPTEKSAEFLERKLIAGPQVLRMAVLSTVENVIGTDLDAMLGPLILALGHPQLTIRNRGTEVMSALSRSGRLDISRVIVWLLRSNEVTVRRSAAEVLRSIKDPHGDLWPKLLSSLRDDDWWVRERVMDALVGMAGNQLSRYMLLWLNDPSDVLRRFALRVLGRLRDPDTVQPVLRLASTDPDWWVREKAIETIAEFRDVRALPVLADVARHAPELQLATIASMAAIDAAAATPHILSFVSSGEADVRAAVLTHLELHGDAASWRQIDSLRSDPSDAVRRQAARLVARLKLAKSDDSAAWAGQPTTNPEHTAQFNLESLLAAAIAFGATDVIIAPDRPLCCKRAGETSVLSPQILASAAITNLLAPVLTREAAESLEQRRDVDASYVAGSGRRFRINLFRQRGGISAVFRVVPGVVPKLEDLHLPAQLRPLVWLHDGLVIVSGPAGSGKSTTMAALIDTINRNEPRHIISIEDPIEVIHTSQKSLVTQREVGTHTLSAARALRSALREDPDVLFIGEMRDLPTMKLALTAAETGHLVFATVQAHSTDAALERIIQAHPRREQEQARATIADCLRAAVCQTLVRRSDGNGLLPATEFLVNQEASANIIRKGKLMQLNALLSTSREQGMHSLDQDLTRLLRIGTVDLEDALHKARQRQALEMIVAEMRIANDSGRIMRAR